MRLRAAVYAISGRAHKPARDAKATERIDAWDPCSPMQQGEQEDGIYAGAGLRPEEYSVMVLIAEYQQKSRKAA